MQARALYDFEAEDDEEISFEAGDIIIVTFTDKDTQDGWWKGKTVKNDKEGYFPSTYVEELLEETEPEDEKGQEEPDAMEFARQIEEVEYKRITMVMDGMRGVKAANSEQLALLIKEKMNKQIAEWQQKEEEEWMKQHQKPLPIQSEPAAAEQEQTAGEKPAELSPTNFDFQSRRPEQWTTEDVANWLIHLEFPEFVGLFKENEISGEALLEIDHDTFREMKVKSVGRRIKLLNRIAVLKQKEPELQDEIKGLSSALSRESLSRQSDSTDETFNDRDEEKNEVRAIADFKSAKQEELNFSKGDTILVLEKPSAEWWKGELNGKTGLFPRSHVLGVGSDQEEAFAERRPSRAVAATNSVLSAIDAVSPQGVKSAKNRVVQQKEILASQKQSRKVRGKIEPAPVPEVTATEIVRPDYQGWLTKQGGGVKSWKRRWFVLKDYCLYYFKDPVDGVALGCITLPSYVIAPTKEVSKKYAFKACHTGARTYFFFADSESEMNLWVKALSRAAIGDVVKSTKIMAEEEPPKPSIDSEKLKTATTPGQTRKQAPAPPRASNTPPGATATTSQPPMEPIPSLPGQSHFHVPKSSFEAVLAEAALRKPSMELPPLPPKAN